MNRAIILLNMGGVNKIDEVEMFLRNMFADKYILQTNAIMRKFIGNIIVKKRLNEAIENYKILGGKSPLLDITNSLCNKLQEKMGIPAYPIMRYTPPFAKEILIKLKEQGIEELLVFSMYPHYSTTTTKSSLEDLTDKLKELDYHPKLKIVESYFDNQVYINLQAELIKEALGSLDASKITLLISAHGLPISIIKKGDPYQKQIETNFTMLTKTLQQMQINFKDVKLVYQSRVGSGAWLEPNLADVLRNPKSLDVLIFPISFTVDNSETVFELNLEHKEIAQKIGYNYYTVTKCPNDRDDFVDFIAKEME